MINYWWYCTQIWATITVRAERRSTNSSDITKKQVGFTPEFQYYSLQQILPSTCCHLMYLAVSPVRMKALWEVVASAVSPVPTTQKILNKYVLMRWMNEYEKCSLQLYSYYVFSIYSGGKCIHFSYHWETHKKCCSDPLCQRQWTSYLFPLPVLLILILCGKNKCMGEPCSSANSNPKDHSQMKGLPAAWRVAWMLMAALWFSFHSPKLHFKYYKSWQTLKEVDAPVIQNNELYLKKWTQPMLLLEKKKKNGTSTW